MPRWLTLSTEVDLHDPSILPTLQCTLQCTVHEQKCITGTQTFLISKLGGWKDTTAFHKSSKTNRHQALKHLTILMLWKLVVIDNRIGRSTFRNWGDIGLSPASRETTQTNKPPKHDTKTTITSIITPTLWHSTCALCASPGNTRFFDRTSVYFCASTLQNLADRKTFIPHSVSLRNDLVDPYLMVWDWRVSRAGPRPFCWPSCSLLFCLQLFFLSHLFLYRLVVWGWGLRTDRASISLSRPCIANLF